MSNVNPTNAVFTPPASNKDNSAVTPGEIVKYVLAVGLVPTDGSAQAFPTVFADLDVTPAADGTISVPLSSLGTLAPGNYMGIVTAVTAGGQQSDPSAPAAFSITPPVVVPNPPTALAFV